MALIQLADGTTNFITMAITGKKMASTFSAQRVPMKALE